MIQFTLFRSLIAGILASLGGTSYYLSERGRNLNTDTDDPDFSTFLQRPHVVRQLWPSRLPPTHVSYLL